MPDSNESNTTTNHDIIRRWAEDRGGRPAAVKGTGKGKDDPGILRIAFPGHGDDDRLEEISWEDFFAKFDDSHLAFLYQEKAATGETSRFFKFVDR